MSYKGYSKKGHFYNSTVEITFNGEKKRVSKDVADSIAKNPKYAKKPKQIKSTPRK